MTVDQTTTHHLFLINNIINISYQEEQRETKLHTDEKTKTEKSFQPQESTHTHTRTTTRVVACRDLWRHVVVLPQPRAAIQLVEGRRQAGEGRGRRGVGGGVGVLPGHGRPGGGGRRRGGGDAVGVVQRLGA